MLPTYSTQDDFRDFFKAQGYVILHDLFGSAELDCVKDEIYTLFASGLQQVDAFEDDPEEMLCRSYVEQRDQWRHCARRTPHLLGLHRLLSAPGLSRTLQQLGLEKPLLSTAPEMRTDMPNDQAYMQPWHQDWRYGQGSLNAITIWTPLQDVSVENGTIEIQPGTHRLGYLDVEELQNPRRFRIVDPRVERMPFLPVEVSSGMAVVFSQMLVHRSGHNRSARARLSVQFRFSDLAEPAFAQRGLPTPVGSDLVWDCPPTASDMQHIYGAVV